MLSDFKFAASTVDWTSGFALETSENSKTSFISKGFFLMDDGNFLVLLTHEQMVLLILT